MSRLGLKVKLALDADGRVGGMIQYLPIEHSPAVGRGLESILCVWCPAQNLAFERARRAAEPFDGLVECRLVDTADRETMLAWGETDALFIDGQRVRTGPPPSEAKLAALIRKRVRRVPGRDVRA